MSHIYMPRCFGGRSGRARLLSLFGIAVAVSLLLTVGSSGNKQGPDRNAYANFAFLNALASGQNTSSTESYTETLADAFSWVYDRKEGETSLVDPNDVEFAKKVYEKYRYDVSPEWIDTYELKKDLLTIHTGPHKGSQVDTIDDLDFYDNDPRLTWSVYLDHLVNISDSAVSSAFETIIPFSWYDWADFRTFNKLVSLEEVNINCPFLLESAFETETLKAVEAELQEPLFDSDRDKYDLEGWYRRARKGTDMNIFSEDRLKSYCKLESQKLNKNRKQNGKPKFNLPFSIMKLHDRVRPEVYELQTRSYILKNAQPLSITILEGSKCAYRLGVQQSVSSNMIESHMLHNYLARNKDQHLSDGVSTTEEGIQQGSGDIEFNHFNQFEKFLNSKIADKVRVHIDEAMNEAFNQELIELKPSDFEFDIRAKIKELEARKKELTQQDQHYLESLKTSIVTHPALASKYFTEPGNIQQFRSLGWHRDERFFNGAMIDDPEIYAQRLNAMIRTFQKLTKANGLISWPGHGTLLGYLWNGEAFPWDNDFDLQMPIKHLHLLSQYFNQSLILEDPREGNGRYIVDVGSSISVRTKGNGKNNIDARFIDIDSGLYIDITGLSVSSAPAKRSMKDYYEKNKDKINWEKVDMKTFDLGDGTASMNNTDLEKYMQEHEKEFENGDRDKIKDVAKKERDIKDGDSPERDLSQKQRYIANRELKMYNCRNDHFMTFDMVSPLTNSLFHGVPTLIPAQYLEILKNEYYVRKEYEYTSYKDYSFLPELRRWLNTRVLEKCANYKSWYLFMKPLEGPLKGIKNDDLWRLYYNFLKGGYNKLFSQLYTTFPSNAYRTKEMEIQFDQKLAQDKKVESLAKLRKLVAPKVPSPVKDPTLADYEKKLWHNLTGNMDEKTVQTIVEEVDTKYLDKLLQMGKDLEARKYELFQIVDRETWTLSLDLNDIGLNLFHYNSSAPAKIFGHSPKLGTQ